MELRHFRYFVAVAEELHFRRAAERLFVSTPTLSQQIKAVEKEIGAPLLIRGAGGVSLTPAGAALLEAARAVLRGADEAVAEAREAAGVQTPVLRFGLLNGAPAELVHRLAIGPTVYIGGTTTDQLRLLIRAEVDLALLRAPVELPPGLSAKPVHEEEMGVMMSARHPLAARGELTPADLSGLELILFPRPHSPGTHDAVLATLRAHGADVRLSESAMGYAQMPTALLSEPTAIGLSSQRGEGTPGLVWKRLSGRPLSVTYLAAWRSDGRPPAALGGG